jgi:hypothetical protein
MIGQVYSDAVEAVCDRRARGTASGEVRPEHKVVDEKLRAAAEKVCQRGASLVGFEAVPLIDWHPRQILPLARQLVASACEFLLRLEQIEPRLQPLFSCSGLVCGHCACLRAYFTRCDLVFDCHALYLARGIEGVGVTSVSGFGWTL